MKIGESGRAVRAEIASKGDDSKLGEPAFREQSHGILGMCLRSLSRRQSESTQERSKPMEIKLSSFEQDQERE